MSVSKFQKFDTETISRGSIKNAPYNPRIMDANSKKMLKKKLRQHGLVSALTWNRRTGNLVGGHQRLEQLDALERNKEYDLTVCVIDVNEEEEAKLNIQLNNPSMQGNWDYDKLADIAENLNISFEDMGFTDLDVDLMFDGDERFSALMDTEEVTAIKEGLEEVKEARKQSAEKLRDRAEIDWYVVVVFKDSAERSAFMRKIHIPEFETYITQDQLNRANRSS